MQDKFGQRFRIAFGCQASAALDELEAVFPPPAFRYQSGRTIEETPVEEPIQPMLDGPKLEELQHLVRRVPAPPALIDYAVRLVRATRLDIARKKGIPAYIVCHDRTLLEIAAYKPDSMDALANIYGMGPARIENYGQPFLATVNAHAP